jgi:hypothetical protein
MKYDLELYKSGQFANTNDGVRLVSLQVGLDVWKANKWLGTGAGDLKAECMNVFDKKFPHLNDFSRKLPHNQFIWGVGIMRHGSTTSILYGCGIAIVYHTCK